MSQQYTNAGDVLLQQLLRGPLGVVVGADAVHATYQCCSVVCGRRVAGSSMYPGSTTYQGHLCVSSAAHEIFLYVYLTGFISLQNTSDCSVPMGSLMLQDLAGNQALVRICF